MATGTQRTQAASETMGKTMEAFTKNMAPNVESMMKANAQVGQMWMEQWNNISRELMNFANTRLTHDMEVMQQLTSCRDPFQAMQLQSECLQKASKQYMDEAGKIADMASEASVNCFKQMDEGLREATGNSESSGPSSSSGGSKAA